MTVDLVAAVREAGVVGAGGAGFPTHVKLASKVNVVIANGAECEPLLACDQALMTRRSTELVEGLRLAVTATGAAEGVIALKGVHAAAVDAVRLAIARAGATPPLRLHMLAPVYPAGDEFVLVYEVTGRVVPEGGLPLAAGALVQNVATLANVYRAFRGRPVTHRLVTVAGEVNEPKTIELPIGASIADALQSAGGLRGPAGRTIPLKEGLAPQGDLALVIGGPMMGRLASDARQPITKTTSGIVVLKRSSAVVRALSTPAANWVRRGRSTCDQCRDCTELCPRYLLGHSLQPHEVMRSINYGLTSQPDIVTRAVLCCECRLCEAFACPIELSPMAYYRSIKRELATQGWRNTRHRRTDLSIVSTRRHRLIPTDRLVEHLGLSDYAHRGAPFDDRPTSPTALKVPLALPLASAAPAVPAVGAGDHVVDGQPIAEIPEGRLGARVHAPLGGVVTEVIPGAYIAISVQT